jgi:hypothetical protein
VSVKEFALSVDSSGNNATSKEDNPIGKGSLMIIVYSLDMSKNLSKNKDCDMQQELVPPIFRFISSHLL